MNNYIKGKTKAFENTKLSGLFILGFPVMSDYGLDVRTCQLSSLNLFFLLSFLPPFQAHYWKRVASFFFKSFIPNK